MNNITTGYIAGLFDADGCIHAGVSLQKGHSAYRGVYLQSNLNKDFLIKASEHVGSGYVNTYKRKRKEGKDLTANVWANTSKKDIKRFCEIIKPYSVVKKSQLELMEKECEINLRTDRLKWPKRNKIVKEITDQHNNNENVVIPDSLDYSWLAGMIDGDGYISVHWVKNKKSKTGLRYPNRIIGVIINNFDLACFVAGAVGGSVSKRYSKINKENKRKLSIIQVSILKRESVKKLLENIIPYLVLKKEKAEIAYKTLLIYPQKIENSNKYVYTDSQRDEICRLCENFVEVREKKYA